jgi:hypothetical protein
MSLLLIIALLSSMETVVQRFSVSAFAEFRNKARCVLTKRIGEKSVPFDSKINHFDYQ